MANALYGKYKEILETTGLNLSSLTIKIVAVKVTSGYTVNLSTHQFLSSVGANTIGTAVALANKTETLGVFDADDAVFTAVADPGFSIEAYIIYYDSGSSATSNLICYIDTAASGLPVRPNGGNITVQFNASGIFAL